MMLSSPDSISFPQWNNSGSAEPANSLHGIESKTVEKSANPPKFLPLPGGEGRGEGERKHTTLRWQVVLTVQGEDHRSWHKLSTQQKHE
jgi:hypothetical protein